MNEMSSGRLEAFSDGVIAIAITLLILDIHVPEVSGDESLAHALGKQWPNYVTYALTFLVIGIMWVNHHALFTRVARVDRALLFLNIALLMGIAFLPFPTSVLARYIDSAHTADARVAVVLYSATMLYIGLGFIVLWNHLARHPALLADGVTTETCRLALRRSSFGPVAYAACTAVGMVWPPLALVGYALVALYFMGAGRYVRAAG